VGKKQWIQEGFARKNLHRDLNQEYKKNVTKEHCKRQEVYVRQTTSAALFALSQKKISAGYGEKKGVEMP